MNIHDTENMQAILDHPRRFDHFTGHLFRLICKADMDNRAKLAIMFPDEVQAVCAHLGRGHPPPAMSVKELLAEIVRLTGLIERQE